MDVIYNSSRLKSSCYTFSVLLFFEHKIEIFGNSARPNILHKIDSNAKVTYSK